MEPSSEGARSTRRGQSEHERTSRDGAGGRDVKSRPDGAKPITEDIGNTAARPASRTVSSCAVDTITSCTPIPHGRSSGTKPRSGCSDPTAPKSVPPSDTSNPTSNPPTSASPAHNRTGHRYWPRRATRSIPAHGTIRDWPHRFRTMPEKSASSWCTSVRQCWPRGIRWTQSRRSTAASWGPTDSATVA